jgi:hypothetical protein
VANPGSDAGSHLALTRQKLKNGFEPERPFLIWAIGSSYTNMLGDGSQLETLIRRKYPNAPRIVYKKMVGNSCPWQYVRGWARHLVIPDQPDLVIVYTLGKTEDLDLLLGELRAGTTADIIVPSIHWRERGKPNWGQNENAPDQDVAALREVCAKYGVEFVENRRMWGDYLRANNLSIESLLKDAVHQSPYGSLICNTNIASHILAEPKRDAYDPKTREQRYAHESETDEVSFTFAGSRVDLIYETRPGGAEAEVFIDEQPANQINAFAPTYIQWGKDNFKARAMLPRDQSPHGVTLNTEHKGFTPQKWTIRVLNEEGDYTLRGSVTGPDGRGNAYKAFTSESSQITIPPELWRRAERNKAGDVFTFEVKRTTASKVSFAGKKETQRITLAAHLENKPHTVRLKSTGGRLKVMGFEVFRVGGE